MGIGESFNDVSRALQNIISTFMYCRNLTSEENFKLKLGTISDMVYIRWIILKST